MISIAWLMLAFPAAGALINLLFGHKLDKERIGAIATGAIILAFLTALLSFFGINSLEPEERSVTVHLWEWITIGDFNASAALLIDPLSVTMALVVTGVGSLIHLYATSYMEHDEGFQRFFVYLNFFIFSMLILVLSDNFLGMFVGWEGVGLASFLLIGFWFDRHDDDYGWYADCGKKAFLVNRVGDFGMLVAIMAIWTTVNVHSVTFLEVFDAAHHGAFSVGAANFICFMLLLGAAGKSAQIPLYIWLPDAMAGPTPVSALIHAATMVTAGIYMIARTYPLWHIAGAASVTAAWIGGFTALLAATMAIVQVDLKKILAYSTISQLGYMIMGVGMGAYGAAIFHLVTHAFFKALLFLGAGSVMHATDGDLDIRKMGGLHRKMPVTAYTFLIGAMALAGIPLLSGFFSKDAILVSVMVNQPLLYAVGLFTALLTAIYSFRAAFVPFFGEPRDEHLHDHAHESPGRMTNPLRILAFLAIFGWLINIPFVLTFEHWLEPAIGHHEAPGATWEWLGFLLSALIAFFGAIYAYARYLTKEPWIEQLTALMSFLEPFRALAENKWYVNEFYQTTIVQPIRDSSAWLANSFDQGIVDGAVHGVGNVSLAIGEQLRRLQNGAIPTYALSIFAGVVAVLAYFLF